MNYLSCLRELLNAFIIKIQNITSDPSRNPRSRADKMGQSLHCVFSVFFLVVKVVFGGDEKSLSRGSKLKYAVFQDHPFHALNSTKVDLAYVETAKHCLLRCVKNQHCFSTNVAVSPSQYGKVLCELLASDKYNSSQNFGQSGLFHHYSISVSNCQFSPFHS